jgi:hypothetical protein
MLEGWYKVMLSAIQANSCKPVFCKKKRKKKAKKKRFEKAKKKQIKSDWKKKAKKGDLKK